MSKYEALKEIASNLKKGLIYGRDVSSWPSGNGPRFPYFEAVLCFKPLPGRDPGLFCWSHYGSSAERATIKDLAWIIRVIFKMTPSEFLEKYTTSDKSLYA